jgi:phosphomannomutase
MSSIENTLSIQQLMNSSGVKFGTSGTRGPVSAMTPELCFSYTQAFLKVIAVPRGSRVAIGMDLRPSSPKIAAACAAAVYHAGLEVDFCGVLPTPALAFYAQENGRPGIMVTGSHIPFDRNGIKFYGFEGEITKADEAAISQASVTIPGKIRLAALPDVTAAAARLYAGRYLDFFPSGCLAGMRVGVYEHSSAAREILRGILETLGAEVVSLGRTDEFVPIDTEAVRKEDMEQGRQWAVEIGFDAILSTDGDADRPLLGDESGQWLRGDVVDLLCAQYLGAQGIATPVSCNTAIERCGVFPIVVRTRIGSPYVIEGMEGLIAAGVRNVVGFEANGGFLLGSRIEKNGRVLTPLMTRDAVLPMLCLLAMARERNCRLSELAQQLPARFTASDRLQEFPTEASYDLIERLAASGDALMALLGDLCGPVERLDQTDGLRIFFENGDIMHLRSSGNAPELRCYAETSEPAKADRLVRECLSRIMGLYRSAGD